MKTLYTAMRQRLASLRPSNKGQSLVETALFFPLLILIIVGVVEVGYLLNTYLAVANAAREGARYGATTGTAASDDEAITSVITHTMTSKGLNLNPTNTSIYLVRGATNVTGTLEYWDEVWTYGITGTRTVWIDPNEIAQEVGPDTEFVVAMAFYDHKTLLGMEWENLPLPRDVLKIAPYTAMRRADPPSVDITAGCPAYPIAAWLYTPLTYRAPGGPLREFLADAQEGDHFELRVGTGEGSMGWLAWRHPDNPNTPLCDGENQPTSQEGLVGALWYPGTSTYTDDDDCWWGYVAPGDEDEPVDEQDHDMNVGDWVWNGTGNINSSEVGDALGDHIGPPPRLVRVVIYDDDNEGTGVGKQYHIARFAMVYLKQLLIGGGGGDKYIEAQFDHWDDTCGAGFVASGPPPNTIIVEKQTVPDGATDSFTFTGDAAGTISDGQQIVVSDLDPGTYTSQETVPSDWDLTSIVCDDTNSSGDVGSRTATFQLEEGEAVRCTFNNLQQTGTIIVEKQTLPDGATDSFSFTGDVAGTISDGQQIVVSGLDPGTYTLQETVPSDWSLTSIVCDDANSSGDVGSRTATFQLEAGETVRCTFNNTQQTGTIIVEKQTIPEGATDSFSFTGGAAGTISDGQQIVVSDLDPGTYTSQETVPSGWDLNSIVCDDTNSSGDVGSRTATFQLEAGETVRCTFTNIQQTGTIIVEKQTLPDGAEDSFTFTGHAAGTIPDGQQIVVSDLYPGTYTSQEIVPSGWNLTSIVCDDTNSSGDVGSRTATFQLEADETVRCTFNNTRAVDIFEPLNEDDTTVSGAGPPDETVTIHDLNTGQILGTGPILTNGTFTVSVDPALVAGHVIAAITVTGADSAVVQGSSPTSTPTPTPTPTSTPTPTPTPRDPYITIEPTCGPVGTAQSIVVHGYNWPTDQGLIYVRWDGVLPNRAIVEPPLPTWVRNINLSAGDMTEGMHTVWAGVLNPPQRSDERDFEVPCVITPTPTPTATPVPPDLIITGFMMNPPGPTISAGQGVTFTVDIENQGESDVNSLFWVAIHVDPTLPLNGGGLPVLWQGVSAIVAEGSGQLTFSDYHFTSDADHVYAYVDNWDHIPEGDETNNASSAISVTVSGALTPTPTPTPDPASGAIDGFTRIWLGSGAPDIQGQIPVYLYRGSDLVMETISDENGYYRFDNVPVGDNYRVYAETMVDYDTYCGSSDPNPVVVTSGDTTSVNLVLSPWC